MQKNPMDRDTENNEKICDVLPPMRRLRLSAGASGSSRFPFKEHTMMRYIMGLGVLFLIIALIAGLFGFIGVGSLAWEGARVFFFIFLVLAVLAFVGGWFGRRGDVT
jgi:uncharacterized membrane protein YtjA (UPF0391 family)